MTSRKPAERKIRAGTPQDRTFVGDLATRVFSAYGAYERILPSCLGDSRCHTLVVEEGGRTAGFCILCVGDGRGEVAAVAVDPLWQGQGIGRDLMRAVVAYAGKAGITLLVLRTATGNRAAQRLFREIGFEETTREEGYYAGGQSAIEMQMKL